MSSPKIIIQIMVSGATIFGRAFMAAGRQAVQNVKHQPEGGVVGEAAGVGHANSSSPTDQLTRLHRLTLDEAQLILNVNRESSAETILKNYEHLFKVNSPAPAPPKGTSAKGIPSHSHYVQSKIVMAKERLDAELKLALQEGETMATPNPPSSDTPPPPAS